LSGLVMRDGEVQESKTWATVGKAICVYLLLVFSDRVLATDFGLAVLLTALIAPDVFKKAITMRYNGNGDHKTTR